jgi:hypothetical protein
MNRCHPMEVITEAAEFRFDCSSILFSLFVYVAFNIAFFDICLICLMRTEYASFFSDLEG